jgi:hypothetical protein
MEEAEPRSGEQNNSRDEAAPLHRWNPVQPNSIIRRAELLVGKRGRVGRAPAKVT